MTKQHFIALARAIAEIRDESARSEAAYAVISVARQFNPRFDTHRFREACNV